MISSPHTTLIRVDPDKHMDRRYSVAVQATLLDPVAVVCVWGSRRSGYQRLRVLPAKSVEEATAAFERIVQAKMRRGYRADGEEVDMRDSMGDPPHWIRGLSLRFYQKGV